LIVDAVAPEPGRKPDTALDHDDDKSSLLTPA